MTKCDRYKVITNGNDLGFSSCEKLDENGCHTGCYESFIDEDEFTGYVNCNGDLSKCPRKQKVHTSTEYFPEPNSSEYYIKTTGVDGDDWETRFKDEYKFAKNKYDKLHKMIVKYEAEVLTFTPKCSLELLKRQAKVMGEYLYILEMRAEIEGIDLDETLGR